MSFKKIIFYFSVLVLLLLSVCAVFPKILTTHSETAQNSQAILTSPNTTFLAGTDSLGRDMMARLLQAARISLIVSVVSSLIALVLGVFWGLISGLGPNWLDEILMRVIDILYSIPDLLFYILLGIALGRSMTGIIIALCSLSWLSIARLVRGEARKYRNQDFVLAARALGQKPTLIATRHILPQMREVLFVSMIFKIPFLIILESTLSFIGLGLKPPYASFGTLAKEGFEAYLFYPHLIVFPCVFIFVTVFGFYSLGNYLKVKM